MTNVSADFPRFPAEAILEHHRRIELLLQRHKAPMDSEASAVGAVTNRSPKEGFDMVQQFP